MSAMRCGAAGGAPQGLCPACLLKRGLEANTAGFTQEDAASGHWSPPGVEELSARFGELEIVRLIGARRDGGGLRGAAEES